MRLLQVSVPTNRRAAVESALDDLDTRYLLVDEVSHTPSLVCYIPVPSGAAEGVLDRLYDAGLDEDAYAVVTDASSVRGVDTDRLTAELVEGPQGDRGISHPELRERADDLWPDGSTYIALALLSAVVATAGLLLDSAIVIVGAMVIAPFAGTTLSASVGWVIDDYDMIRRSARAQVVGLVVAVLSALGVSVAMRQAGFVPRMLQITAAEQVGFFITPSLLALAIAICAGAAGALALATDLPVSIAGVAVAAAIVPAAAAFGIGAVWGLPLMAFGAIVLLLMNIFFINVTAYAALVLLGYRSSVVRDSLGSVGFDLRTGVYALLAVAFVVVGVGTTAATAQHIAFEHSVGTEVTDTLDDEAYSGLELHDVSTQYNDMGIFGEPETVTVEFGRSSDRDYATLARTLQDSISDRTGHPVTVRVQFTDYSEATPVSATLDAPSDRRALRARSPALRAGTR
ncbi:DUF389 domain-containing protein [Halomarina litorea]|uniref:DUF389 domain-containing protein n=1 Tax=Halomarina litorea TaxID=2961595 RepID=UPI0020C2820A|nr:DUF389 domain-containing protein [Halomarina sp. BCD28]